MNEITFTLALALALALAIGCSKPSAPPPQSPAATADAESEPGAEPEPEPEAEPEPPDEAERRAKNAEALGKHREAALAYTRACRAAPERGSACLALARLYDRWRFTDQAIAVLAFGAAKVADPRGKAEQFHRLGVMLDGQGKHAEAVAALNQALALDPDLVGARAARGFAYAALGDRDRAIADLEMVMQSGLGSPFLRSAAGARWLELKRQKRSGTAAIPEEAVAEVTELPETPAFDLPEQSGPHSSVLALQVERERHLESEVSVAGVIVWKYDCAASLAKPGRTRRDIERLMRERPELCSRPHFILGDRAGDDPRRGLWVVDVPRPIRPDEEKALPAEVVENWPEVPEIEVGDQVVVTGRFALRSPQGFSNSDGLLVYEALE